MGYGFVTFETEELAEKAFQELNKREFNGRVINVEMARARTESAAGENAPRRSYRGGFRGGRGGARYSNGGNYYDNNGYYGGAYYGGFRGGRGGFRGARRGRPTKNSEPRTGEPSKTTLFVANLPFSMNDEQLATLFQTYRVTKAHVVTMRSGRSKGFGFVEFAGEDEQLRALQEMANATVDNRPISVKIALDTQTDASTEVTATA
jgi:RNA recognition motif-containing protein